MQTPKFVALRMLPSEARKGEWKEARYLMKGAAERGAEGDGGGPISNDFGA